MWGVDPPAGAGAPPVLVFYKGAPPQPLQDPDDHRGLGTNGAVIKSLPLERRERGLDRVAVIGGDWQAEAARCASAETSRRFAGGGVVLVEIDTEPILPTVPSSAKRNQTTLLDPDGLTSVGREELTNALFVELRCVLHEIQTRQEGERHN